jgi:hypothetical protein
MSLLSLAFRYVNRVPMEGKLGIHSQVTTLMAALL